jgi:predicted nucleic acid-binding protein
MTGADTSILIPLAIEEHPLHESSGDLFAQLAQSSDPRIAVAPLVLSEFVHAVADPKRFETPLSVPEAIEWVRTFIALPEVTVLMPEPEGISCWLRWMGDYRLGRKRVLDTLLAASLHTAGVSRLLTANPADFRVFGIFDLLVPARAEDLGDQYAT